MRLRSSLEIKSILFKRITFYPQLVLGLAFNWGALLGWSAIHGDCDWSIVAPLYLSGISWTMVYDTWYAHQDKADDSKLGLKSTALAWGDSTSVYASGFASLMILSLGISGYSAGLEDSIVFKSGLATAAAHLLWQIKLLKKTFLLDKQKVLLKYLKIKGKNPIT